MPKATWDKDRALELFQEGADDLAIAEAVGTSQSSIRAWRWREQILREPKKKVTISIIEPKEITDEADSEPKEAVEALPDTLGFSLAALDDALFHFEDSVMDLIRESFHRRNAAIRERCLLIMEILSGVYEHIEKMQKENAAPSAATPESGK